MSALFLKMLNLSIKASWLILAVILVRLFLKKAPKRISCVLWALAAVRLICPFSIESALSLIPSRETIPGNIEIMERPAIDSGITVINEAVNPVIAQSFAPELQDSVNPLQLIVSVLSVVWLAGIAAMLLYALISYFRLKKSVGACVQLREGLLACDEVKSPFILGIIKPVIYVPSSMEGQTLEYVITHETAHIRRRDHWWKPFGYVLLSVYWFNPLCWLAYVLLCRDIEMACDEKVIRDMDKDSVAGYSQALLDCSFPRRRIAACPLAFGEVGVKERVKTMLNYKKPAFWIIILAVAACIAVGVFFMTDPKGNETKENETKENQTKENETAETETIGNKEQDVPCSDIKGAIYRPVSVIIKPKNPNELPIIALDADNLFLFDRYSGLWSCLGKPETLVLTEENFDKKLSRIPASYIDQPKDYREQYPAVYSVKTGDCEYLLLFGSEMSRDLGYFVRIKGESADQMWQIAHRADQGYSETLSGDDGNPILPYVKLDYFERTFSLYVPKTNCGMKGSLSFDTARNLVLTAENGNVYTFEPEGEKLTLRKLEEKEEETGLPSGCVFADRSFGRMTNVVSDITGRIGDQGEYRVMLLPGVTSGVFTFFVGADGQDEDYMSIFTLMNGHSFPELRTEDGEVIVDLKLENQTVPCRIRILNGSLGLYDPEGNLVLEGMTREQYQN